MPALYKDPAFSYSSTWFISSSQLSSEYFNGYGWSQVVDDGWGIAYMINENSIQFNVCSKGLGSVSFKFYIAVRGQVLITWTGEDELLPQRGGGRYQGYYAPDARGAKGEVVEVCSVGRKNMCRCRYCVCLDELNRIYSSQDKTRCKPWLQSCSCLSSNDSCDNLDKTMLNVSVTL